MSSSIHLSMGVSGIAAWACVLACGCSNSPSPMGAVHADATTPAYILDGTEVREIQSAVLKRTYQVYVSLPASYRTHVGHRFPVIFVPDADYVFPLIRSIARRVGDRGAGLEDFVLIGISYTEGETPEYSRRRDYTPTAGGDKDALSDMPGRLPIYGHAEQFRRFIQDEVFPLVEHNYLVDMKRKIYAGHSYGGLLGAYILLTQPTMFERYIISSLSLWFDNRVEDRLRSPRYPGLQITSSVLPYEDHLTVLAAAITRALKWAHPPIKVPP